MSDSRRDQRGRLKSGKRCPEAQNGGCAYCITGDCKRDDRRRNRREARREIRSDR